MAEALGGNGAISLVFHAADFFVTRQRYDAFKATIDEYYPEIEIVAEQGIGGPDFTGDAEKVASAMLISNPELNGIWAVWDVPAEGVISAARTAGRDDLVITTIDLGENVAINMASVGFVKGLGAQRPFDQGVTEAVLAGFGLLDKAAPEFVALPALPVTKTNLLEAWQTVYWRDGTTHVVFEPLDFIARLAALIPKPRVNLTRFHGVFAPNSRYRARVTPTGRGPGAKRVATEADNLEVSTEPEQRTEHVPIGWAQRLRRVFGIDIERCAGCGGTLRIIACIEDRAVIEKILAHRRRTSRSASGAAEALGPPCRAPPPASPLG